MEDRVVSLLCRVFWVVVKILTCHLGFNFVHSIVIFWFFFFFGFYCVLMQLFIKKGSLCKV
jgi:hypothetical protein